MSPSRVEPRDRKQAEAQRYEPGNVDYLPFDSVRALQSYTYVINVLQVAKKARILELGCGTGGHAYCLAQAGFSVIGVDISPEAIRRANDKAARDTTIDLTFLVGDMEELELHETFDAVIIFDAMHHCERFDKVIQVAFLHLRPGGEFVFVEPNLFHRFSPHARREVADHGTTELGFTRRQLARTLRAAGFRRVEQYYPTGRAFHAVVSRRWRDFAVAWLGLLASRAWHSPGMGLVVRSVR